MLSRATTRANHIQGFGEMLRRLRMASGLTQEVLAERSGLSVRGISDLERGISLVPREYTVQRLVSALDLQGEECDRFIALARELRSATEGEPTAVTSRRISLGPSLSRAPRGTGRPVGLGQRIPWLQWWWTVTTVATVLALIVAVHSGLPRREASVPAGGTVSDHPIALWGTAASNHTGFQQLDGIALGVNGNVYLADFDANVVEELSSHGRPVARFGDPPYGQVRFAGPLAVAVDRQGNLYVIDHAKTRLQKVSPGGRVLLTRSLHADGVALDAMGNVFTVDALSNCVREIGPNGRSSGAWGSENPALCQFARPQGIAVDGRGRVYVADTGNRAYTVLSSRGMPLRSVHNDGIRTPTPFPVPLAVAVNAAGDVYEADGGDGLVLKYSPSGRLLSAWGAGGRDSVVLGRPTGVAVDRRGNVYVADAEDADVVKLSPRGRLLEKWTNASVAGLRFERPEAIALDRRGDLYVADTGLHRVQKISRDGKLLSAWGGGGVGPGQFVGLDSIAVDSIGRVFTGDLEWQSQDYDTGLPGRIQIFSPSGRVLDEIPGLCSVTVDRHDHIYGSQFGGRGIVELDSAGNILMRFRDNLATSYYAGLAVSSSGDLYAVDPNTGPILKFSSRGRLMARWGGSGSGPGKFYEPAGIALDRAGRIYVADAANDRIQVLSPDGHFLLSFGQYGQRPGDLNTPNGVAVDAQGDIFVADTYNNRVQEFAPIRGA